MTTQTWNRLLLLSRAFWTGESGTARAAALGSALSGPPVLTASLIDGLWQKVYDPLSNALASQQHMIQLAALAMIVALFLIWRRQ